jgi:hypothetical protein
MQLYGQGSDYKRVNTDMTAITFPTNPTMGQEYIPNNSAVYVWLGNRWSTAQPVIQGQANSVAEGGSSTTVYNELTDNTIGGGGA